MTVFGFWKDDALVASEIVEKFWADPPAYTSRSRSCHDGEGAVLPIVVDCWRMFVNTCPGKCRAGADWEELEWPGVKGVGKQYGETKICESFNISHSWMRLRGYRKKEGTNR